MHVQYIHIHVRMYACICACIYVCVYVHMYTEDIGQSLTIKVSSGKHLCFMVFLGNNMLHTLITYEYSKLKSARLNFCILINLSSVFVS